MYNGFADDTKAIFEEAYIGGEDPDAEAARGGGEGRCDERRGNPEGRVVI